MNKNEALRLFEFIVDSYVKKYGEENRELITSAIRFCLDKEMEWGLRYPLNKKAFIEDLLNYKKK